MKISSAILCFFLLFFCGCDDRSANKNSINRGFFYWKSRLALSNQTVQALDSLQCNSLYIKLFDVGWNTEKQQPEPIAKLVITAPAALEQRQVVPCIFITDECIFKLQEDQINELANNIYKLTKQILPISTAAKQVLIDCDWTKKSRANYFALLQQLKVLFKQTSVTATIRLHQVKYTNAAGIPPVTRGLLMCYNMGNLRNPASKNSIIEFDELKKYTAKMQAYPIPLDIGLPVFEWLVVFRQNKFAGLIQQFETKDLQLPIFSRTTNGYLLKKDTVLQGYSFKKNDFLRVENSETGTVVQAGNWLSERVNSDSFSVVLYHLDSITLKKYSINELENIYRSLQ